MIYDVLLILVFPISIGWMLFLGVWYDNIENYYFRLKPGPIEIKTQDIKERLALCHARAIVSKHNVKPSSNLF